MDRSDAAASQALARWQRILQADPRDMDALVNSGVILHGLQRYGEALAAYDAALAIDPGYAVCLVNRALTLHELGRLDEAIATLDYAAIMAPSDPEVTLARGNAHLAARDPVQAQGDFETALALRPSDPQPRIGIATALAAQGDFDAALAAIDAVPQPDLAEAHFQRGNILRDGQRLSEAVAAYDDALRCDPQYVRAQRNKGLCLLLAGDYARGLPLYEWRKRLPIPVEDREYSAPLWTGAEDISGKTLFAYIEQGLGDTIQFFRFVAVLRARGARVILSCQDNLARLLQTANPVEIIGLDAVPPHFDFHIPLASIPLALGMRLDTIPAEVPYLFAERRENWAARIGASGYRIGVVWQGGLALDPARSFPLALLRDIGALRDVRLISLQKGPGLEQLAQLPAGMTVERLDDFDEGPQAFLDTAAVMMTLDLVVTPDTATAHLAGALGRPTAVMLKQVPDWRWLLDRGDSPWYPTVRLFRQGSFGDWTGAFAALKAHVAARRT